MRRRLVDDVVAKRSEEWAGEFDPDPVTNQTYDGQMQKNRKESKKRRNAWLREMRPY
jgi:hypothetical protein